VSPNNNVPVDQHGFVLTGTGAVYGSHLAMFNMAQHRYHVVAEITLPDTVKKAYTAALKKAPATPIIVVNPENKKMHLQDMLGPNGFPSELWQLPGNDFNKKVVLAKDFTAKATKVLHNRAFNDQEQYPSRPRYLVFGSGGEAHASHYMTHQPDYQLLVQLAAVPAGLTTAQLADGILVDLTTIAEDHKPARDPLEPHRNTDVAGKAVEGALVTMRIGPTRWFDTRELNHQPHHRNATLSEYMSLATV
jgi:hypothetical protein